MIDTKKVELMTKIAIYEKNEGAEDIRINKNKKTTYVGMKLLETLICVTIAYILLVALCSVYYISAIASKGFQAYRIAVTLVAVLYVVLIIFSMAFTYFFYSEKYKRMTHRIVLYDRNLANLSEYILSGVDSAEDEIVSRIKKDE